MKSRSVVTSVFACVVLFAFALQAQEDPRPQISPGVGSAVLLAKNSIQIDSGVVIASGDVVVNNATSGPVYGEKALSLDRDVRTPAGHKIAGTSIDLDQNAIAGGDAYYTRW